MVQIPGNDAILASSINLLTFPDSGDPLETFYSHSENLFQMSGRVGVRPKLDSFQNYKLISDPNFWKVGIPFKIQKSLK